MHFTMPRPRQTKQTFHFREAICKFFISLKEPRHKQRPPTSSSLRDPWGAFVVRSPQSGLVLHAMIVRFFNQIVGRLCGAPRLSCRNVETIIPRTMGAYKNTRGGRGYYASPAICSLKQTCAKKELNLTHFICKYLKVQHGQGSL